MLAVPPGGITILQNTLAVFGIADFVVMLLQGLGGLQSLDLSLNGLSSVPLGVLDELQTLR